MPAVLTALLQYIYNRHICDDSSIQNIPIDIQIVIEHHEIGFKQTKCTVTISD